MYNKKEIKVENASNHKKKNPNMKGTSKNIQSSINTLISTRNQDLFGPLKKKYYIPYEDGGEFNNFGNMKQNMKKGGEAFPQQPTMEEFFQIGYIPQSPVGYYACGGEHIAMLKKAMGGEADTTSTDTYLKDNNDYFKNLLNFNSLNAQAKSFGNPFDLPTAGYGISLNQNANAGAGYRGQAGAGPNPQQGQTFSDGYGNDPRFNQNPNIYTQTPVPQGYGYNPNMGWFGGMMGRIQPRYKININNYGQPNQQQPSGGPSQGSSSGGSGNPAANTPQGNPNMRMKVNKAGILNTLFPHKFGPKSYEIWNDNNPSGTPASTTPPINGSANPNAPAQSQSPYKTGYMPGPTHGGKGNYMGPDMNEPDTNLPKMSFGKKEPKFNIFEQRRMNKMGNQMMYENSLKPWMQPSEEENNMVIPESDYIPNYEPGVYSPFTTFPQGPMQQNGNFRNGGGIPMYVDGGNGPVFTSDRSWGIDVDNLNPNNIIAFEQQAANFLNAGQNQRLRDEQMARNMDVMNFSPTDTQFKRGFNMFDPTIMQNPERTGVQVTSAGQSNVAGQRGMQFGGQLTVDQEVEMSDDELQEFFRNGGTVEYLD